MQSGRNTTKTPATDIRRFDHLHTAGRQRLGKAPRPGESAVYVYGGEFIVEDLTIESTVGWIG